MESTPEKKTDILEKSHKTNLQRLIEEFGAGRREEICSIYSGMRDASEQQARIKDYTPIFVYRNARDCLRERGTTPRQ